MSLDVLLVAAYFDQAPLCHMLVLDDRYSSSRGLALAWASRMGSLGVVKVLIKFGISCTENVLDGSSAICWAAAGGYVDIINILLEYDPPSVNAKSGKGCTPLMMAVSNAHRDVVQILL